MIEAKSAENPQFKKVLDSRGRSPQRALSVADSTTRSITGWRTTTTSAKRASQKELS